MTDDREALGRAAFGAHVSGLAEQDEPPWQDKPPAWEELGDDDREFYMRIGSVIAAEALRRYEAERAELTLARLSRSAKLAQIRAYCRRRADLGDPAEAKVLAHILGIIGGEEEGS